MEIKQAEAQKKSAIGQNNAAKEVAESNAELEVTKAEASRKAGEAQARTQAAVLTAQENAQREIEEAKARKDVQFRSGHDLPDRDCGRLFFQTLRGRDGKYVTLCPERGRK